MGKIWSLECHRWMVNMLSKEQLQSNPRNGSADSQQLQDFYSRMTVKRSFNKTAGPSVLELRPRHQVPPFYFLRSDIGVLLGPSGGKLLNNTWSKYHLSPGERSPEKLRPALVKLFSVAARIAAPRGVGQALRKLLKEFERGYFPIVEDQEAADRRHKERRFALLCVIQNGQGGALLSTMTRQRIPSAGRTAPSRLLNDDPNRARRRFLFESAYRNSSWDEAFHQGRILLAEGTSRAKLGSKFTTVCRNILNSDCPDSKKKQALVHLTFDESLSRAERRDVTLRAVGPYPTDCRPGAPERQLCELLPHQNPWWFCSLSRAYRHRPSALSWLDDLRALWQSQARSRPQLRVLLNTIRLPQTRAQASIAKRRLTSLARCPGPLNTRATLQRVRDEVSHWLGLLPPNDTSARPNGGLVKLPKHLWSFLSEVCLELECEIPVHARITYQWIPVTVQRKRGRRVISIRPEFLAFPREEQMFLLARALFRSVTGLENLEQRALSLTQAQGCLERSLAYAEWSGHEYPILEESCHSGVTREQLLVGLEEMYWRTGDRAYRDFALVCYRGCWSPLFDRESDLFAASFVDLTTASHSILKTQVGARRLVKVCEEQGLNALAYRCQDFPALCLRLQSLWMHYLREGTRNSTEQLSTR